MRFLLYPFALVWAFLHATFRHGTAPIAEEASFGGTKLVCPVCRRVFWRSRSVARVL